MLVSEPTPRGKNGYLDLNFVIQGARESAVLCSVMLLANSSFSPFDFSQGRMTKRMSLGRLHIRLFS